MILHYEAYVNNKNYHLYNIIILISHFSKQKRIMQIILREVLPPNFRKLQGGRFLHVLDSSYL